MWRQQNVYVASVVSLTCTLCSLWSNQSSALDIMLNIRCHQWQCCTRVETITISMQTLKRLHATQQKMIINSKAHPQNLSLCFNLFSFTNHTAQVNPSKIEFFWE